jgi:hypothetical protein
VNAVTAHATLAEATRSHDPVPLRSVSG